jgi:hypothetical protein
MLIKQPPDRVFQRGRGDIAYRWSKRHRVRQLISTPFGQTRRNLHTILVETSRMLLNPLTDLNTRN